MAYALPTFSYQGQTYTVDVRLREFRAVRHGPFPKVESISFNTAKGRALLGAYINASVLPRVISKLRETENEMRRRAEELKNLTGRIEASIREVRNDPVLSSVAPMDYLVQAEYLSPSGLMLPYTAYLDHLEELVSDLTDMLTRSQSLFQEKVI